MTAVTQCPQCGTRFRVVPDQLKISHGWVRCGKCAEVFNAREALEAAAALKAGRPVPASTGLAPQQVSIVLRQQEPAPVITDADTPTCPDTPADAPVAHDVASLPADDVVAADEHVWPRDDGHPVTDDASDASFPAAEPVPVAPPDVALAQPPAWLIKPVVTEANGPTVPAAESAQAVEALVPMAVAVSALQQTVAHWVRAEEPGPDAALLAESGSDDDVLAAVPAATDAPASTCTSDADMPAAVVAADALEPMDIDLPIDSVPLGVPTAVSSTAVSEAPMRGDGVDAALASHAHERAHEPAADVGFIRQARRQAAWSSGPARAALGALVMFASALLALQVSVHERDRLAAMAPALKPWLIQLCEPIGCEISPFQHIEALEIVSTELVRAKDGTYRFEMGLRNTAALPVAMPAVELSLTDRSGEAVVRRVVLPGDWVAAPGELTPTSETSLTLKMSLVNPDELRMEGFRAVVFYP